MRLPIERWARIPDVRWIVPADWEVSHPDVVILESLDMDFIDVLASSDLLLCKPGYGSFAEAAVTVFLCFMWLEKTGRKNPI